MQANFQVQQLTFEHIQRELPRVATNLNARHAAQKRDAAIQRAQQHANAQWKTAALDAIEQAARAYHRFTTDAVIELLAQSDARTHEPRALGPLMRQAAKLGWIVPTNDFEKSAAVSRHRAPKMIWVSNLYVSNLYREVK